MEEQKTPVQIYKDIIDQLVSETRNSGSAAHVASSGVFSNAPDHRRFNKFIASLSPSQQQVLSAMLREERHSAIHDVLAVLTWYVDCEAVGLTCNGQAMPVQLSGMGLHGDYIGRCDDWEWPDEEG